VEACGHFGVPGAPTVNTMIEPKAVMRSGFSISCVGHVVVLTVGLIFAGANPFDSAPADSIMVDLVSPDEIAPTGNDPALPETATAFASSPPAAALPESAEGFPQAAPRSATRGGVAEHDVQQPVRQSRSQPTDLLQFPQAAPLQFPQSAARPREPSVAEQQPSVAEREPSVADMFALPLALPDGRLGGGFDAPAFDTAKIPADDIAMFREHLKTCLTRPGSVAPTDKVRVVLRVSLKPDGTLATTPTLIEASASAKGPALMASVVNGLRACQPYAMLPADKYQEWKVLDLSFTPHDFGGG
jgi:hypothetical protein